MLVACPAGGEASPQQGLHCVPQIELLTAREERAGFLVPVVGCARHACAEQPDTADQPAVISARHLPVRGRSDRWAFTGDHITVTSIGLYFELLYMIKVGVSILGSALHCH